VNRAVDWRVGMGMGWDLELSPYGAKGALPRDTASSIVETATADDL